MSHQRRLKFRSLRILLLLLTVSRVCLGTGIEEPTRWLGLGSKIVLDPPEFFFELETKRIAADLHPEFSANVAPGSGFEREYGKQTDAADLADFEDAIKTSVLRPPDQEKALGTHKHAVEVIGRKPVAENPENETAPALPSSTATSASVTPSPTPRPAPSVTDEFPSEFADYHRGALAYHAGDTASAQRAWQSLLDRAPAERKYRTSWAEYMLGKMALESDNADEARRHFHQLRDEVKQGSVDSLGLAVASIGWEAQIELKAQHFAEAARLYLEQRAAGDPTAASSLHVLMNELSKAQPDLAAAMADPLLQRLTTAAELCGIGAEEGFTETNEQQNGGSKWLQLLEKANAREVKDADCVAWMEYQKGDYKAAEHWLKLTVTDSPYALWLRAKLALRDGKIDMAAHLLSRALPKLPPEDHLEMRSLEFETMPTDMSKGDLGSLHVGRADFITAAKLFVQVRNCDDATYLAEGVLTLPELKKFVDELPEKSKQANESADQDDRKTFREIIGRRLARAGNLGEARQYFDENEQKALDEYVEVLKKGNDTHIPKAERADALWKAAQLIADHNGHNFFDYALPSTTAGRLAGREVQEPEVAFSAAKISYGGPIKFVPPVTTAEKQRLKSNIVPAVHHYHADYIAADLAWRAAQLMPDNNEETAKVLNTAGSWLKKNDDKGADKFYQAIERRCAKTELGQQAIKRHWFVPNEAETGPDQ